MRRKAKIDGNQDEIVSAYRSGGWAVRSTAQLGDGFPDLVVAPPWEADYVFLVEIKIPKAKKERSKAKQDGFAQAFPVAVVKSIADVHAHMERAAQGRAA